MVPPRSPAISRAPAKPVVPEVKLMPGVGSVTPAAPLPPSVQVSSAFRSPARRSPPLPAALFAGDPKPPVLSLVDAAGRSIIRVWLVARDSFTLVAHWTPPAGQLGQYSADWDPGNWSLRTHLAGVDEATATEVALDPEAHPEAVHQFIPVLRAGQAYITDLGYRSTQGRWRSVARSEAVSTPPEARAYVPAPDAVVAAPAPAPIEYAVFTPAPVRKTTAKSASPASVEIPNGLRPPTSAAAPSAATRRPVGSQPEAARPSPTRSAAPAAPVAKRIRIVEQEFTRQSPGSSESVITTTRSLQIGAITGEGAADVAGEIAEGGPAALPPSSEAPVSAAPRRRKFWFEVNAELIVHGRTERGATVTLGGKPIKLRADGSFTFRFALPDGDFPLPAVAISAAGDDRRSADLRFVRTTAYDGDVGVHPISPSLQPPAPRAIP